MTNTEGPWGGEGDNPWAEPLVKPKKPKVVDFSTIKETTDIKDNGGGINPKWVILALLVLWLSSGFYQIESYEQGVVLRLGKYLETNESGLHYKLPFPIDTVSKVDITTERSINLGMGRAYNTSNVSSLSRNRDDSGALDTFTESHMLTGDENIVDINLTVVWKVKDAKNYLFSMRDPDQTVTVAAQSVLREIVGQSKMQDIITGDRGKVEDETKEELQNCLNEFTSGVQIVRVKLQKADPPKQVVDAFNEVQRAKADMERFKNEAEAYRNEVLPKARGEAEQLLQNAQGYKEAVIAKSTGDAERFLSVYSAYAKGKDVTAKRLYLEAMEEVLAKATTKTLIDPSSRGSNVLPLLPLNRN